ncbi:MAG: winged helix-turn-helix transcriptional regulator [Elusimicrobia bacterium]|nr:winged helix-turn-helix transcriptional regulator [Elusimicrobiota bacterium]
MKKDKFKKFSVIFRALSHPVRLMIVDELLTNKKCVTEIKDLLKVRQPNISQHLLILRMNGIVDYEQAGKMKCYFLKNPRLIKGIFKALETAGSKILVL